MTACKESCGKVILLVLSVCNSVYSHMDLFIPVHPAPLPHLFIFENHHPSPDPLLYHMGTPWPSLSPQICLNLFTWEPLSISIQTCSFWEAELKGLLVSFHILLCLWKHKRFQRGEWRIALWSVYHSNPSEKKLDSLDWSCFRLQDKNWSKVP